MAIIILEPNESFEHFHNVDSTTTLVEGTARCKVNDTYEILEIDIPLNIPAHKSHLIENTGLQNCVLRCGHGTGN